MIGIYLLPEGVHPTRYGKPHGTWHHFESTFMNHNARRHFLKTSASLTAVAASAGLLAACGGGDDVITPVAPTKNIVEIAQATPDLSILVEAVVAAGLAGTLSAPGTLTVFAPTNLAFTNLLTELGITKAALLANVPLLTKVLTYHVLTATVKKADIPLGKAIDPILTGTSDIFKIDVVGANVVITDGRNRKSNITDTDILATNGVVHLIDKVILPADKDIVATALASNPEFTTLVAALQQANLVTALQGAGPFTVFAPTNLAFDALRLELGGGTTPITVAALLANPKLADILKYHVLTSRVLKADITAGAAVATLAGATETISINSSFVITDKKGRTSNITGTDILASNGVIHVINKVILPSVL
jgi:uncharacterized surface protein with fasciclin (FAS1) repeats